MTKGITIIDEGGDQREPVKRYREEEVSAMSREFVEMVKGFCDKYQAALIGGLLFSTDTDENSVLFVMQGAFPGRAEVDKALAVILTETRAFYEGHRSAGDGSPS